MRLACRKRMADGGKQRFENRQGLKFRKAELLR
jgi:hypothetical protein